jgi:hypothetical protein
MVRSVSTVVHCLVLSTAMLLAGCASQKQAPTPAAASPADAAKLKETRAELFTILSKSSAPFKPARPGAVQCTVKNVPGQWRQVFFKEENKGKQAFWTFSADGAVQCSGECVFPPPLSPVLAYVLPDLAFDGVTRPGIMLNHDNGAIMKAGCEIAGGKLWIGEPGGANGGVLLEKAS